MKRILFVCMGNICRSPTAEAVLRTLAKRRGRELEIESAGTVGSHAGEGPDARARKAGEKRGYDFGRKRARKVAAADFGRFDLILAMDRQNLAALERQCPPEHLPKLALFLERAGVAAGGEVPDPYYGGPEGFERVLDLCEQAAEGLLRGGVPGSAGR